MAKFNLTGNKTVAELKKEFNEAFGSRLKVYNGGSIADDNETLGNLGLKEDAVFECRSSRTAASFIESMKELGLKVTIWTRDSNVKVLDGLTLKSTGEVKNMATKKDMEDMIAYQREEKETSTEEVTESMNLIDKLTSCFIVEDDDKTIFDAEEADEYDINLFKNNLEDMCGEETWAKVQNMLYIDANTFTDYLESKPDGFDLAYNIIGAALCTSWGVGVDDDAYLIPMQTYYFNDNEELHYETKAEMKLGY